MKNSIKPTKRVYPWSRLQFLKLFKMTMFPYNEVFLLDWRLRLEYPVPIKTRQLV